MWAVQALGGAHGVVAAVEREGDRAGSIQAGSVGEEALDGVDDLDDLAVAPERQAHEVST